MGRFDAAIDKLDRALDAIDKDGSDAAERLRVRLLITRSLNELEVNGLGPALRMLQGARNRAMVIGDRLLVALSYVQEGGIHLRSGNYRTDQESCVGHALTSFF